MSKLRSIQVLRGLAATGVILCHTKLLPMGAVGVDIFFVISGFIIANVMPGRSAGQFLLDRVWRICPIYWIASAPWLIAALLIGYASSERTLASMMLWPIYSAYANPYLRVAWTLCFEMLFYAAATLALLASARLPLAIFAVCFVANLLWPLPLLSFVGSPLILEFLAGTMLTKMPRNTAIGGTLLAIGLIALSLAPVFGHIGIHQPMTRLFLWGAPSAAVVYGALCLERFVGRWANALVKIGDASYSIYLWHLSVCVLLPVQLAVPGSLAAGLLSYQFIERPILKLRKLSPSDRRRVFGFAWPRKRQPELAPPFAE